LAEERLGNPREYRGQKISRIPNEWVKQKLTIPQWSRPCKPAIPEVAG